MTSSWLPSFFHRPPPQAPLAVDAPLAIIGDIHGRVDLLVQMLARLDQEAPKAQKVFVGDYVDRGPDSAAVLRHLMGLPDAISLMGNHERMLLDFLEDPDGQGGRWLKHGGIDTLASFGIVAGSPSEAAEALRAGLGTEMLNWLKARPLFFKSGTLYVTHASADPDLPLEEQDEKSLLWGHAKFGKRRRMDGCWVAHGHTIVPKAQAKDGIIALDTGAFATDRLTAAMIADSNLRFLEVGPT